MLSRYSRRNVYALLIVLSVTGFILAGLLKSPVGIAFIFLPFVAYYFAYPLISSDLHRELSSGQRATGESFMNLTKMLVYIPIALGFGLLADRLSVFAAYLAVGVFVGIYLIFFLLASFRKIGHIKANES